MLFSYCFSLLHFIFLCISDDFYFGLLHCVILQITDVVSCSSDVTGIRYTWLHIEKEGMGTPDSSATIDCVVIVAIGVNKHEKYMSKLNRFGLSLKFQ